MDVSNAGIAGANICLAYILIKSNSAGFCVQISSQNREAIVAHQIGNS
jgi:hypothetical protein